MAAIAYFLLHIRSQGSDSILRKAVGRDRKGKLLPVLYVVALVATSGEKPKPGAHCSPGWSEEAPSGLARQPTSRPGLEATVRGR